MNKYIAYYKHKQEVILANTSYDAQQKAAIIMGAKKTYDVTVVLAEKDGKEVIHTPDF